jgi:hypothetical protein
MDNRISHFGFKFEKGGVHTSRTMMLEDLRTLLSCVSNPGSTKAGYLRAIEEDNCLGKRSGRTRKLTAGHLVSLYSLDSSVTIFRSLLYFWNRDTEGQPLLALMCAYGRDSLLRKSSSFILKFNQGEIITRKALEEYIDSKDPGHFSIATLRSTAQNLNSTWTKSGHLSGKARKTRSRSKATPGSVSYGLFLGYLMGFRGEALFMTDFAHLLDCSVEKAIELAEEASRRGWIVFKHVGNVIEVQFPNLLTVEEREWIRDQN